MRDIKLNNNSCRFYSLADIRENSKELQARDNPSAPFSYSSYAGALEAHYSMLYEFVEKLVTAADKLELTKEYNRLVEEKAQEMYLLYKNDNKFMELTK